MPDRTRRSRSLLLLAMALSIAVLAWATWQDVRLGNREIERLMTVQAVSLIDVIKESGSHGLEAYRSWEDEVVQRLTDDAVWIARADSVSRLTSEELFDFSRIHRLHRILLFDSNGDRELANWPDRSAASRLPGPGSSGFDPRYESKEVLAPILEGRVRTMRLGIRTARFTEGTRLGVAAARSRGGAVVVNVSADSLRAVLERVGPGHLFRTLGEAHGVRYIAIQDGSGVLAASEGMTALLQAGDDPWILTLQTEDSPITRVTDSPLGRVFEAASIVSFPEADPVILRIGLATTALDQARAALVRRTWMRTGLLTALLGLAVALLLAWQRHGVLADEVDRIGVELRAREHEVLQSQKLVAMGELASGVAHEVRNPLNAIHMIAQQLERETGIDSESRSQVAHIKQESRRIEAIVQQFLTFARPRQPQLEPTDLGAVLAEAGRTAEPSFLASGVMLTVTVESVVASIDRSFVAEIVENLLRNAREASPSGGRVELTVTQDDRDAIVAVTDQGPGVPREMRDRIFDLYFTTKPNGSGLGLPLVVQMVGAMQGRIRLDESYDAGARFVIRFPVRKESV